MATTLPLRPSIEHTPESQSVINLAEDVSIDVLASLASETARTILTGLTDEPATASDLAENVDTSLQNVHYHLDKLCAAGVVTTAGTWYSSKGKEMTVYALTTERLVVQFGPNARTSNEKQTGGLE